MRSPFRWDLIIPMLLWGTGGIALLVWSGGAVRRATLEDALARRLAATARAVALQGAIFRHPAEDWQRDLARLAASEDLRISVISGDGTPLADTAADVTQLPNQSDQPAVRAAIAGGMARRLSQDQERMIVAAAVERTESGAVRIGPAPGLLWGVVRLSASLESISQSVRRWRWGAGGLALAGLGIGLAWVVLVAWRRSTRLARLTAGFEGSLESSRPPWHAGRARSAKAESSPAISNGTREFSRQINNVARENAALRAESERRRTVLDGMAEGVLAIDGEEVVLLANEAAGAFLNVPAGAMAGRPLWEVVRLAAIHQAARAALSAREAARVEIELPRSATVIALRARPFPEGTTAGAVLVLHDITELRRLENIRREFVSNVSHELKTPLASIQAYTETLLEGAIHDEQHNTEFLRRIHEQADRLHHLVLDLLRLARIEAGTDVFEIQRLAVGQVIEPCLDEHAALAHSRGLRILREPPEDPVRVRADPEGLRTILDNLLDNALQYTPEGGRITVRWFRQDHWARIEVSDTGIGIPPEHLDRIFERFHRVDKARSRELGGTGLGLAIVKHLAQVFEGRVEVVSAVDQGSTFRLLLPAG